MGGDDLIGRLDGIVGDRIEAVIRSHHRRRLRRAGQLLQLQPLERAPLYAAGSPPPREGSSLDVLIDGAAGAPAARGGAAEARSTVHIAGWHVTPGFWPAP